jgi:hypothetical protein
MMTKRWKIILGSIMAMVGLYCIAALVLIAKYGWAPARHAREVPSVGWFKFIGTADSPTIRVKKVDGVEINISYKNGKATDKIVMHPKGHLLYGRVQPLADQKTLHEATELLPTLIAIAKGRQKKVGGRVLKILEDYPDDLYRHNFKKEPGKYHLQINDSLFLKGYDFRPHAQIPYVAYWGPESTDSLGDDIIYCGNWVLDKFCQNLPLKVSPESLHRVKAGDVIDFAGCNLIVEYIDHDNDQDPRNNSMIIRIEGLKDLSQVEEDITGGQPVKPSDFVRVACWPTEPDLQKTEQITAPVSQQEVEQQIRAFANSKTERQRGAVVKDILLDAGYTKEELIAADNGYEGSEDIWVIKKGQSDETAIIAAHYDKTGPESQGVHDNACGVVVAASAARALRTMNTHLTYIFLFYGAHEIDGHDWSFWLVSQRSQLQSPIKYAVEVGGGGLIGAEQTFALKQKRVCGWLHWRYPELRINETGGPPDYLKHTAKDNITVCDFARLVKSQNQLLEIVLAIEENL